ncbi:hypothetical protein [Achromobacter aegrifaciens]|uniref:Transmembrane protein n=1 Tax=Achromobacter aegrifaciens TaxID=1287736 RepID=A0ABU2DFF9_ACHAE|nr:hypothetical protein [Achromobacter aegrifaciens]MDR7946855.1 hypothetical protein [Achromobacter aegrifaciens]
METALREILMALAELGILIAWSSCHVLPLACVLAVIIHLWPQRFGKLGTLASMRWVSGGMAAIWVCALSLLLLLYWVASRYDNGYGYAMLGLMTYMSPSLIMSLVALLVHWRLARRDREHV